MRGKFQIVCLILAMSVAGNVGLGILLSRANSELSAAHWHAQVVQVIGKQFEWYFRYPGEDGQYGTEDELISTK